MSTASSTYQPGRCNIGRRERTRRYGYAAAAFVVAAAIAGGAAVGALPAELVPAVFVPLALGIEWYLQASRAFCAVLAAFGRYRFDAADEAGRVSDPEDRHADRTTAFRMTATAVVAAALLTAAVSVLV